jgi:hypothetical protein
VPDLVVDRHTGLFGENATATFSADRVYRYALTRRWQDDLPVAVFVMLNPSTADAFMLDPTIRRCIVFARSWSCGGLVVVNLFALRATDPAALRGHSDPVGPDNDWAIAEHLSDADQPVGPVICAWGAHPMASARAARVEGLVRGYMKELLCLGRTKQGHPRHPLYVPGATATEPYRTAVTTRD